MRGALLAVMVVGAAMVSGCIDPVCQAALDEAKAFRATVEEGEAPPTRLLVDVARLDDGTPLAVPVIADLHVMGCWGAVDTVHGSTNAAGEAVLDVSGADAVTVWVPGSPERAAEGMRGVPVADSVDTHVRLRVLQKELLGTLEGAFGLAVREEVAGLELPATFGKTDERQPWSFHDEPPVHAVYAGRLEQVDVTIHWNNAPTASAGLRGCVEGPDGTRIVQTQDGGATGAITMRTPGFHRAAESVVLESPWPATGAPLTLCAEVLHSATGLGAVAYHVEGVATFADFEP